MKRLLIAIPLVFLCCLGCQQGEEVTAVDVEADIQAIKDIVAALNVAVNTGDIDKLSIYHADEAIVIPSNSPATVGKDAIIAAYEQLFNQFTLQEKYIVEDVQVSGNLAVAHAALSYVATPKDGQDPTESKGNQIMVLRKQADSTWKFIYVIWSDESLIYPDQTES